MTVGDLCDTISDTYHGEDEKVVLINTSDVLEGKVLNRQAVVNKNLKGQFKKTFKRNDILYSEIRPANKRYAFVDFEDTENYIASTKLMVLRSREDIVRPRFLLSFLSSKSVLKELQQLAETRSGTFPQITFSSELAPIPINIPDLETQDRIVEILDVLERKISTNTEINKNLHQQYMLLVDRFISQLDSYDIKPLSDIADCQNGRAFYKEGYDNEGAFVIDLGNVNTSGNFVFTNADKYISLDRYNQEKLERYRVLKNDLVMVMTDRKSTMDLLGKVGKIYKDGYYLLNQRMYRIRAKNGINVNYLYACLNSTETSNNLKEKALGSVQKYVNTGDICDLKIKIPPKDVMEKLSEILNPIFLQMENNILQNEILVETRDILLPKLMSNEIDVSTLKI